MTRHRVVSLASVRTGMLASNATISNKDPVPVTTIRLNLKVSSFESFRVKFPSVRSAFLSLRHLLSERLIWKSEESEEPWVFLVLYEAMEILNQGRYLQYRSQLGLRWIALIRLWELYQVKRTGKLDSSQVKQVSLLASQFLPSSHAFFGMENSSRKLWQFIRENDLLKPRTKPQAFVGVGYKDKGSRRNVARDGSPSWKDVASAHLESGRSQTYLTWGNLSVIATSLSWKEKASEPLLPIL